MESERTWIGGRGGRGPRRGDVLAERYEIAEVVTADALVGTYRAIDHENEGVILVRATAPGVVGEKDARRMVERMRDMIGVGHRVLSPLRDVDREGTMVLTVEPWPRGTSLRAVLDARRAKGIALTPRELVPVITRVCAAIAAIPESFWHGDIRAERVWVDPESLVLTGAALISSLPGQATAQALANNLELRRLFAPEVGEGLGGRPSDRWGVGAIAWEALLGAPFDPRERAAPPSDLGAVGQWLARLLDPDPAARPATLEPFVAALAELGGLAQPKLASDTVEISMADIVTNPSIRIEDLGPDSNAGDTAKHPALGPDGAMLEGSRGQDLDPRLVRAALSDRPPVVAPPTPEPMAIAPSVATKVPSEEIELDVDAMETADAIELVIEPAAPRRRRARGEPREVVPLPEGIKPIPRPKIQDSGEISSGPVLYDASKRSSSPPGPPLPSGRPPPPPARPSGAPRAAPPASSPPRPAMGPSTANLAAPLAASPNVAAAPNPGATAAQPNGLPIGRPLGPSRPAAPPTTRLQPAERSSRSRARSAPGWLNWAIVAFAVILASGIIAVGFWYRAHLRDVERQRIIEQRLEELHQHP